MSRSILRRMRKLEGVWTDSCGYVPNTPEWLAYWTERLSRNEPGDDFRGLTLQAARAVLNAYDGDDELG